MRQLRAAIACEDLVTSMGDSGNLRALAARGKAHGVDVVVVRHLSGEPLPAVDLLMIAGADEVGLVELHNALQLAGINDHYARGSQLMAVNAGYQVLLTTYEDENGHQHQGFGMAPGHGVRADLHEGAYIGKCMIDRLSQGISGFEAHYGRVTHRPGESPLSGVQAGVGNGDGSDGFVSNQVLASFVHGPLLARNPALADWVLGRMTGSLSSAPSALWGERANAARIDEDRSDGSGWGGERYGRRLPVYSRLRVPGGE